jgi:threonine dehydratase
MICASAGNFGQAMAYACRKRNTSLKIYAATTANPYKVERMKALGAEVRLHGDDFDSAKEEAKRQSKILGIPMIEDGLAIETIEGAGTIALELQGAGPFDALLIPLGNGALFNGIAAVFKALQPSARMIAVQAAGAPAMVESWRAGKMIVKDSVKTIADGIAVRVPIAEALDDMNPLIDEALVVGEESILKAMKLLHVHAGVVPEPSAAVGIAAILENRTKFEGLRVGTIICGGNLTEKQIQTWLN